MRRTATKFILKQLTAVNAAGFTRIGAKIEACWGSEKLHTYFANLLTKDRAEREGFPPSVYKNIMFLYMEHNKEFGDFGNPISLNHDFNVHLK